jgi:hypothetical protein
MATPFFQVQTQQITMLPGSPGSLKFLTKDANGVAVDVSSGYTLGALVAQPTGNRNLDNGPIALTSDVTATFSTTGVTIAWTGPQATTISGLLQTTANQFVLGISNDAGTTITTLAASTLTIQNYNGAL